MKSIKPLLLDKDRLSLSLRNCHFDMLVAMRNNLALVVQERERQNAQPPITFASHPDELRSYAEIIIQDCQSISNDKQPRWAAYRKR